MINDLISDHINNDLSEIHTNFPAKVLKYDAEKQCVDIQPLIKRRFRDDTTISMPVIHNVPIIFPFGGGALFSFPIKENDIVLVICCERSIDKWLSGDGSETDPEDTRKFNISDAIAIPGLCTLSKNSNPDAKKLVLKYIKGNISIDENSSIVIASDSSLTINTNEDIIIKSAKSIQIKSDSTLKIDCSMAEFSGNVKCKNITCDELKANNDVMAGIISLSKHTHTVPAGTDKSGGFTGVPMP